jgi:hypothetical protein
MTFDEYARHRWGFDACNIDEMCEAVSVVEDLQPHHLVKSLSCTNSTLVQEFYDLTQTERIRLARMIEQEMCLDELTHDLVHRCRLKLFPDKCTEALKDKF